MQKLLVETLLHTSFKNEEVLVMKLISELEEIMVAKNKKVIFFDETFDDDNKNVFNIVYNKFNEDAIIVLSSEEKAITNLSYMGEGAEDVIVLNNNTLFTVEKAIKQVIKQKKIEDALKLSDERYKLVSKATGDMVWDWDLQTNNVFRSETGWRKILGKENIFEEIDPVTLIDPDSWRDRIHEADKVYCDKVIANILDNPYEINFELEYRVRKNDNSYAIILDKGYVIRNEQGEAIRLIGAARDYTEKRMLESKIELERSLKQNEITSAVITAQEYERAEIGKELHDNINQLLATSKLYIEFSLTNPTNNNDLLISAKGFVETALKEIRLLTKALMPPSLGKEGLSMALQELVNNLKKVKPFAIHSNWQDLNELVLTEPLKLTIFRIVQEQLNNIIKHAKATEVWILLEQSEHYITLNIKDDGVGFDLKTKKDGLGLKNIYSRTDVHNGTVKIITQALKGCSLTVQFKL